MSNKSPNDPTAEVMSDGKIVENDINRTVLVYAPDTRRAGIKVKHQNSRQGASSPVKREELEDLVGGVNISPYISAILDTSAEMEANLDNLDDKYAMLTDFAGGGTSRVSVARDRNLRRLVAVKSLRKDVEKNPELLRSFVAEAKLTAQLDHPGIIPIYEISGDDENGIHLVMKLVNGKTLREYLRNTTLNYRIRGIDAFDEDMMLRKRLEIFLRVCDTIAYAHHRNVIHRDLKPENIMIGKYMEVFVMDWGIAKVIPQGETTIMAPTGKFAGTPRYFAPEVLRGEPLDPRSDIFTLGLILQEIVTLQYAINGKGERECMDNIINGVIAPIEHLYQRKIDKFLRAIIHKATAYWIEERYQTVDDLAEDLRRYMAGLSISAIADTAWEKFKRRFFGHHFR